MKLNQINKNTTFQSAQLLLITTTIVINAHRKSSSANNIYRNDAVRKLEKPKLRNVNYEKGDHLILRIIAEKTSIYLSIGGRSANVVENEMK